MYSAIIKPPAKKNFAVLDMGTSKVVCVVATLSVERCPQILSVVYKESAGIYSGAITNAKDAGSCILSAIEDAEKESGEVVEEIYVNVAGSKILSQIISSEISDINSKVTLRDIKRIFNKCSETISNKEVIIHNIPIEYTLDSIKGIVDPIGMYGSALRVNMHTVTMAHSVLLNLEHCITQFQAYFKGCVISAYSSGLACISNDEKELGVTVIDIGGGSTSVGIFQDGNLVHTISIPVGGNLITRDIACAFSIDLMNAEKLKVLRGNVILTSVEQDHVTEVETIGESENTVQISVSDLVGVIRPRVEEIFEMVYHEIKQYITNRVVLTGGTSQLLSIRELASHVLGCQVRLGIPNSIEGLGDYDRNPALSATVGSISLIIQEMKNSHIGNTKKGIFNKMLEFVKGE